MLNDGFLWAPLPYFNKDNKKIANAGWKQVPNIKQGDIIFCNRDQKLIYVVVANEDAILSERPDSRKFDAWKKEGVRVNVDVFNIHNPISTTVFRDEFFEKFNNKCTPKLMSIKRKFCEQYAISLPSDAGEMLISRHGIPKNEIIERSDLLNIDKTYPYDAGSSWTILSKNTAYKKVDKTLIKEISTGIPQDIVRFFTNNNFDINSSINLKLNINGTDNQVTLIRKNDGRHKLKLINVKSTLKLNSLKIGNDKLWFERDLDEDNQFYAYTKSIKTRISVTPKSKFQRRNKPNKPGKTW